MKNSRINRIVAGVLTIAFMVLPVNLCTVSVDVSAAVTISVNNSNYVTIAEAANAARKDMLNHEPAITVYIKSLKNDPEGIFYEFQDEVMKETDQGDEGDYMYWDIESQSPYYTYKPVKIGNTTYYYYKFNITIKYFTTLEQKQQVDEKVKSLIQGFGFTKNTTEYEKVKTIYDYVCNNVRYAKDTTQNAVYTSWSALFNKEAVCQGYAQLMYRMLKEVGISCRVIPGYGKKADVKHGWNIVKIGDYYYNIDATWDSQNVEAGLPYEYFLKGDNFKYHTRLDDYNTAEFYADYPMAAADYGTTSTPTASYTSQQSAFSIIKPKFKKVSRKNIKLVKVAGAYKYQIKYSTVKSFKKFTKTINTKKTIYKLKNLKKKKAYYVKFRAYKFVNKSKTYTQWSNIRKIKKK